MTPEQIPPQPTLLVAVPVDICTACVQGEEGECHTPGCMFFICPAPTAEQAARFRDQMTLGRLGRSG